MKKTSFIYTCVVVIASSVVLAGGPQRLSGNETQTNRNSPAAGADSTLNKDTVPVLQQPQEVMYVSPRILIGYWRGKDSLGKKVAFSFSEEPSEGEPAIFHVNIRIGKRNVSGVCSYWENNMCDLMLETSDLQYIRSRWFFKFDGTWMTIQLGDNQRVAGTNVFKLKKDKGR